MVAVEDLCYGVTILAAGRSVFNGSLADLAAAAPPGAHRLGTSDDRAAVGLAGVLPDVEVDPEGTGVVVGGGFVVRAGEEALDRLTVELGRNGIAVRSLTVDASPLTELYFRLTGDGARPVRRSGDRRLSTAGRR